VIAASIPMAAGPLMLTSQDQTIFFMGLVGYSGFQQSLSNPVQAGSFFVYTSLLSPIFRYRESRMQKTHFSGSTVWTKPLARRTLRVVYDS